MQQGGQSRGQTAVTSVFWASAGYESGIPVLVKGAVSQRVKLRSPQYFISVRGPSVTGVKLRSLQSLGVKASVDVVSYQEFYRVRGQSATGSNCGQPSFRGSVKAFWGLLY